MSECKIVDWKHKYGKQQDINLKKNNNKDKDMDKIYSKSLFRRCVFRLNTKFVKKVVN